jgi:flagellar biosynthesis/type III secretory pathway protein FliH
VLAHPEPEVARVALLATSSLPSEQRTLYLDVIVEALPRAVRHALEELMANQTYKPKHELTIRLNQKFVEAEERGLAEGTAKGLAQGLEALRALLRKQLVLKFGALPHEAEERLARATADELERYGERFVTADALANVFE